MKRFFYVIIILQISILPALAQDDPFAKARSRMVEQDLKGRDITEPTVLKVSGVLFRVLMLSPMSTTNAKYKSRKRLNRIKAHQAIPLPRPPWA